MCAGISCADPGDQFSVGDTTATGVDSLRVLESGDIVPGISGRYDLGVSTLVFRNINSNRLVASTQAATSDRQVMITSMTTVAPSSFKMVCSTISAVTAVTLFSQPNITTGTTIPDGMQMVITSTATNCGLNFQDDDTLPGSSLELAASSRTVSASDTLSLIYDALVQKWKETGYSNNDAP